MLFDAAIGFLNHLLAGEDWARGRLGAFAGQSARLELGGARLLLEITPEGYFSAGHKDGDAAVTIKLPADAPVRALFDPAALFAGAQVSGPADLAECLGFVFRNLKWDVESDLSGLVGDVAARRLAQGGRQLANWQMKQARNLALNLAEYFTEESPTIARRQDIAAFCSEVAETQAWLARLEKRIASLEA